MEVTAPEGIQGSREALFVQFSWAVYYTAVTLLFSSIMLVTVLELLVWVLATCATAAALKIFAYKLCGYWGIGFKQCGHLLIRTCGRYQYFLGYCDGE